METKKEGVLKDPPAHPVEPPPAVEPAVFHPSHDQVAELAYRFWENDGRQDGRQDQDWHKAEAQLRAIGPF